jgi:hypothetical protein
MLIDISTHTHTHRKESESEAHICPWCSWQNPPARLLEFPCWFLSSDGFPQIATWFVSFESNTGKETRMLANPINRKLVAYALKYCSFYIFFFRLHCLQWAALATTEHIGGKQRRARGIRELYEADLFCVRLATMLIINCIVHSMYAKSWCGASVNDERDESGIILWYRIMTRKTRKSTSK